MAKLRQLIAGNWKMNGTAASLAELDAVKAGIVGATSDVAICPPATLIAQAVWKTKGSTLMIGGQDCHPKATGAHTGDISSAALTTPRGTNWSAPRPKPGGGPGSCSSFASEKPRLSGRPGRPMPFSTGNWRARCRTGRPRPIW